MGRGLLSKVSGITNPKHKSPNWHLVKYMVFDAPSIKAPFHQRIIELQKFHLPSHVLLVKHIRCKGDKHLASFHESVKSKKGEGVILRNPDKFYEINGRSKHTSCKLKVCNNDQSRQSSIFLRVVTTKFTTKLMFFLQGQI